MIVRMRVFITELTGVWGICAEVLHTLDLRLYFIVESVLRTAYCEECQLERLLQ